MSERDFRTLAHGMQGRTHRLTAITAKMASQIASAIAVSTNRAFCRPVDGGRFGCESSLALAGFGRDSLFVGFRRLVALTATYSAMAEAQF